MWHRFLEFPATSLDIIMAGEKRKRALFKEEYKETRINWCKRLRAINIHDALKQVIKEQTEFQGVQEAVIQVILVDESPVVAVIGINGGKNLLFMLPAFYSGGRVSIVIMPLIVL
jgi:superfamily II DNA helicase RecQ